MPLSSAIQVSFTRNKGTVLSPSTVTAALSWPHPPLHQHPGGLPRRDSTAPLATHLLNGLPEDVLVLLLGHLSLLVERLDGQLHLLHRPLLHVQLLHVLG